MTALETITRDLVDCSETIEEHDKQLENIYDKLLLQKDKRICCLEAKCSHLFVMDAKSKDETKWREWQVMKLVEQIEDLQVQTQKNNDSICELEVKRLTIHHEMQKKVLEEAHADNQRRLELLEERVPVYVEKIEEQNEEVRSSFRELHGLHNSRNRILLQRLRHVIKQYTDLCDLVEENLDTKVQTLEI